MPECSRRAHPRCVQLVDEGRELPLVRDRPVGCGQHDTVAAGGQPSQRGIDQVRDHIAHSPCAGQRWPLPVFGRECAQQPDDVGRQRAEQGTSVGGRQRHGWEYNGGNPGALRRRRRTLEHLLVGRFIERDDHLCAIPCPDEPYGSARNRFAQRSIRQQRHALVRHLIDRVWLAHESGHPILDDLRVARRRWTPPPAPRTPSPRAPRGRSSPARTAAGTGPPTTAARRDPAVPPESEGTVHWLTTTLPVTLRLLHRGPGRW